MNQHSQQDSSADRSEKSLTGTSSNDSAAAPTTFEGESFRTPLKREGEDFQKMVQSEGEDFRIRTGTPLASHGIRTFQASRNAPLRLMHVGPCFMTGGVEQHTLSLAKFLNPGRVRFEKCLVTNPDLISPQAVASMPFPVEYCPTSNLSDAVSECDVLLLWGDGYNQFLGENRPPLCLFVAHGESSWTGDILRGSNRVVDHVIAVSSRVQQRVCRGIPSTTILNGADTGHLGRTRTRNEVRQELGFVPQDFVLGSVSRFSQEKQIPLLIEAVKRLPRNFKLLLVGHGARREELIDQANDQIPGRYAFVNAADYLGDYYQAMDAFGLVSEHEGFGLVIAEAMLCGRPVIATDVGCVPEIVRDRINGVVVEPTAEDIAAAVQVLHDHPAWARGLAAEGQATAEAKLQASRMAREYEDLCWKLWRAKRPAHAEAAR